MQIVELGGNIFKLNTKKIKFFQKIKISIFNLEKYGLLITEKLKDSIKYILLLTLIFTIIETSLTVDENMKMTNKAMNYIENEMNDFEIKNGQLVLNNDIEGYDEEYDLKFLAKQQEELEDTDIKALNKYSNYIVLLKDKMILSFNETYREEKYIDFMQTINIEELNQNTIIELYNQMGGNYGIAATMFLTLLFTFYIVNIVNMFMVILMVAIFGYFVARISKIKIKYSTAMTLAIYSLTLSIVLDLLYIIQLYFTGFRIEYFDIVYLAIAYIYIVAAILIIKSDLIKQMIELQVIGQIQKNIAEEIEEKKEEKEEKKEDKKEKNKKDEDKDEDKEENSGINEEPDGSEI